jgi:hypothetical protein
MIGPSRLPSEKLTDRLCTNVFAGVWNRLRLGSFNAGTGVTLLLFRADRTADVGTELACLDGDDESGVVNLPEEGASSRGGVSCNAGTD